MAWSKNWWGHMFPMYNERHEKFIRKTKTNYSRAQMLHFPCFYHDTLFSILCDHLLLLSLICRDFANWQLIFGSYSRESSTIPRQKQSHVQGEWWIDFTILKFVSGECPMHALLDEGQVIYLAIIVIFYGYLFQKNNSLPHLHDGVWQCHRSKLHCKLLTMAPA